MKLLLPPFIIFVMIYISHEDQKLTKKMLDSEWEKFKSKYKIKFETAAEDAFRKGVYYGSLKYVDQHNALYENKSLPFKVGPSLYSMLTEWELPNKNQHQLTAFDCFKKSGDYFYLQ